MDDSGGGRESKGILIAAYAAVVTFALSSLAFALLGEKLGGGPTPQA